MYIPILFNESDVLDTYLLTFIVLPLEEAPKSNAISIVAFPVLLHLSPFLASTFDAWKDRPVDPFGGCVPRKLTVCFFALFLLYCKMRSYGERDSDIVPEERDRCSSSTICRLCRDTPLGFASTQGSRRTYHPEHVFVLVRGRVRDL